MNRLYFGDNLQILRDEIKDEVVDLIYLDPPFNSSATYNVLFKSPKGQKSGAQIAAFEDTWHWGEQAEREFSELLHGKNTDVAEMMQALRKFLGENDMMAYLTMMANRLVELQRVLKPNGSLYLHCDPTASHYLKIVLDGVFGAENYRNEVTWKRTTAHSSAKRYAPIHDTIFYYSKGDNPVWNEPRSSYTDEYLDRYYKYDDGDGRLYWRADITGAGIRTGDSGKPWRERDPTAINRHWALPQAVMADLAGVSEAKAMTAQEKLDLLDKHGLIYWPKGDGMPQYKRFRDQLRGVSVGDIWDDIDRINPVGSERLGYPTQKPLALLERIIAASSNEGNVVLDPFCGCGTAVHAAHKLKREWIGIDITHLAIALIEKRLRDAFPGLKFEVHGTPKDLEGARDMAARKQFYEFQYWACSLVNAQPYQHKKKGADSGIDGLIYFQDDLEHMDKALPKKIIVSVKGGENVSVQMVRDLRGVLEREKAAIGLFVTLADPTKPMREEAVKAGYYTSPSGANFPKLQVLSVKGLLDHTERPKYPADLAAGGHTFKKAAIDHGTSEQSKLF
jgi:DNA modification methylase